MSQAEPEFVETPEVEKMVRKYQDVFSEVSFTEITEGGEGAEMPDISIADYLLLAQDVIDFYSDEEIRHWQETMAADNNVVEDHMVHKLRKLGELVLSYA